MNNHKPLASMDIIDLQRGIVNNRQRAENVLYFAIDVSGKCHVAL